MFRTILFSSAALLALISPLAAGKPEAHEWRYEHRHEHCYKVYYRESCNRCWCFGGEYRNHGEAERAAEHYRCRGFEAYVR